MQKLKPWAARADVASPPAAPPSLPTPSPLPATPAATASASASASASATPQHAREELQMMARIIESELRASSGSGSSASASASASGGSSNYSGSYTTRSAALPGFRIRERQRLSAPAAAAAPTSLFQTTHSGNGSGNGHGANGSGHAKTDGGQQPLPLLVGDDAEAEDLATWRGGGGHGGPRGLPSPPPFLLPSHAPLSAPSPFPRFVLFSIVCASGPRVGPQAAAAAALSAALDGLFAVAIRIPTASAQAPLPSPLEIRVSSAPSWSGRRSGRGGPDDSAEESPEDPAPEGGVITCSLEALWAGLRAGESSEEEGAGVGHAPARLAQKLAEVARSLLGVIEGVIGRGGVIGWEARSRAEDSADVFVLTPLAAAAGGPRPAEDAGGIPRAAAPSALDSLAKLLRFVCEKALRGDAALARSLGGRCAPAPPRAFWASQPGHLPRDRPMDGSMDGWMN